MFEKHLFNAAHTGWYCQLGVLVVQDLTYPEFTFGYHIITTGFNSTHMDLK